jgi:hypothetical protein
MNRNVVWILLLTAQLVGAGSLPSFEASCAGGCGGGFNGPGFSFVFGGPFPGFLDQFIPGASGPSGIEFGIGTNGGEFFLQNGGTTLVCDHGFVLAGVDCDGEVLITAAVVAPDERGHSLGDVVSVVGAGTAQGSFCYDNCLGPPPPLFDVDVRATYQFTLTDPGGYAPYSWTGASFVSVPEPATWALAMLGLAGLAAGFRGRRRFSCTLN